MPWIERNEAGSSSDQSSISSWAYGSQIVDNDNYPALSFPESAEKPLTEQLEPIAVIGMGCRLPRNISSPSQFWQLMMSKGTGQTPKVPSSRFNIDAHFHSNNERPGSFNVLGGYFLDDDLQGFDPGVFGISPIEAMWCFQRRYRANIRRSACWGVLRPESAFQAFFYLVFLYGIAPLWLVDCEWQMIQPSPYWDQGVASGRVVYLETVRGIADHTFPHGIVGCSERMWKAKGTDNRAWLPWK